MRLSLIIFLLLICSAPSVFSDTTVKWWQFWTDPNIKPVIAEMIAEFEAENPGVKIELTDLTWSNGHEKIAIGFASGSGPDVVELGSDWIAQFAANGHLANISDAVAADSARFDGWSMADYDDNIYAFPWFLGTRILFVNRDLVIRTGREPNYLPIGWGNLAMVAKEITDLDDNLYGWGSNTPEKHRLYKKFLPFFITNKAKIFTDEGDYCVVSSEPAIEALTFYRFMHDSTGYVSNQRGIEDAFLDGKIGFILSGDWLLKRIELENHPINFNTTLFPGRSHGQAKIFPGTSFLGGEFLAINNASENKEAALKFIKHITSPENQVRFCRANRTATPSSREAQEDTYFKSNQHLQTFIKQLRLSQAPPVDPDWVFIEAELEKAVENVLFGDALPATALRNAQINITRIKKK